MDDDGASANFAKFKILLSSLRIFATVNRVSDLFFIVHDI